MGCFIDAWRRVVSFQDCLASIVHIVYKRTFGTELRSSSYGLVSAISKALSRPVIPNKIRPLPNLSVQQLRSMIEILRMPIHRLDPFLISFSIHVLDQFPSNTSVTTLRIDEQVIEIDDIFDASGKGMRVPSNKSKGFSGLRNGDCAIG